MSKARHGGAAHADPSAEAEHDGAEHGHPPAEEDIVPSARIVLVGVAALVIFFIGSLFAGLGMISVRRAANPTGPPPLPAEVGQAKIGIVEQRLFENANQGVALREYARRRLQTAGWVDRKKGTVHIPIDRAMDMVQRGARP
ncbi:MAG TPA: hypothetical protein VMK12_17260 [Anaeromyxobacteraceae bacterium]|nr:hypothetical protein [Anaeromyxobacteraceae bacterium]